MIKDKKHKCCLNCKHRDECCYRGGYSDHNSWMSLHGGMNPYSDRCISFEYKEDQAKA